MIDTTCCQQSRQCRQEHQIKAWLVDLDGTLYHARPLKVVMALQLLCNLRQIEVIRTFRIQHRVLRAQRFDATQSNSTSPFDEQIRRTAATLGLNQQQVERTITQWMIERPGRWIRLFRRRGLVSELKAFRESGGKTALVSDYPARYKLEVMGLSHLFDLIVANGESGGPSIMKPCAQGYLMAATKLGVHPSECLVIGDDSNADRKAAEAAGMRFRWIR